MSSATRYGTDTHVVLDSKNVDELVGKVSSYLEPLGIDSHPFKVSWYNEQVTKSFKLNYDEDTLAVCLVSTPFMFEKGFMPFLDIIDIYSTRDPLDQCMTMHLQQVKRDCLDLDIEIIHDFDLMPNRRPKILVQTAGHVSGAAYYYQMNDVVSDAWKPDRKMFGVSIHPKYSGWFSFRGILVFRNVRAPGLILRNPVDIVSDNEKKIELLERFNCSWQDWSYRDIVPSVSQYSEEQRTYFSTPPSQRAELLKVLKEKFSQESDHGA